MVKTWPLIILLITYVFASSLSWSAHDGDFVKGQILLKTKGNNTITVLNNLSKLKDVHIKSYSLINGLKLVTFDPSIDVDKVLTLLTAQEGVLYAEPDYIMRTAVMDDSYLVNDIDFLKQWSLHNTGQNGGKIDADINAPETWAKHHRYQDIVIGIIDSGIDYLHPDLLANIWVNKLEIPGNNQDDDNNGYIDDVYGINALKKNGDPFDDHFHGTHVAGIMAATSNNKEGIAGIAPQAKVIACKFLDHLGFGSVSDALSCMECLAKLKTRKVDPLPLAIINMSFGGSKPSLALLDAIKAHEDLGILIVAAAGNYSSNNDLLPIYPASFTPRNIIAVGASDMNDDLASFSNFGKKTVHVIAPGHNIYSTLPHKSYGVKSGTSMAAPHVSGLLAILAMQFNEFNFMGLKNLLLAGGQKIAGSLTLSGRRIRGVDNNGVGSLSCRDQYLTSSLGLLPEKISIGESILISALHINCERSAGELRIFKEEDNSVILKDDGQNGDIAANDGIVSLLWRPIIKGVYEFSFGQEIIRVNVQ